MLITISGMVGSGKSTTASTVCELLASEGFTPQHLRFRYLRLFGFRSPERPPSQRGAAQATRIRAEGFRLRPLTAFVTAGYIVRILAFRRSDLGGRMRCDILDRYFYDSLVNYRLRSYRERIYARILRALIPTPDLAILVVASEETIIARRGNYARDYVIATSHRYSELPTLFPHLVVIRTDPGSGAAEEIRAVVRSLVSRISGIGPDCER